MFQDHRADDGADTLGGILHVANGSSTARTIEAAGLPGRCSIWADPLHDGPVPDGISDRELVAVRVRHLTGDVPPDPVNDPAEWRRAIARHASSGEIVLWYEHDLFCQLNLVQLLAWIHEHLPAGTAVSLICIDSYPGRPAFKGLGELTAAELAPLFGTRVPVDAAMYDVASRAWRAFRAPTPAPLDRFRRENTAALPFLSAALERLLREYPADRDGLSHSERRLLTLAGQGGGLTLAQAFPKMHEGEHAYYVTDLTLLDLATRLAGSSPAFLELTGGSPERPFERVARLTAAGRDLLDGRLDLVRACGIDRWIGGVHLQGHGPTWRWNERAQRIVHA